MGCDNNNRCDDPIRREAAHLANLLDSGRGEQVAQRLHNDAYNMHPREFNRLVEETRHMDRKGQGDDIHFNRRSGSVEITSNHHARRYHPCDVFDNRVVQMPSIYVENNRHHGGMRPPVIVERHPGPYYPEQNYPQERNNAPAEGAIIGGVVGAGLGAILDRRNPGRGAAIGGLSGVIGGAIGGSIERNPRRR